MSIKVLAAIALAFAASGSMAMTVDTPDKLLKMTPEAFRESVAVKDDPLEFVAILSTEPGFRNGKGLTNVVWDDAHLRAVIDKRTGVVRYEVEQFLRHRDSNRVYNQVNYMTPAGLRKTTPVVIDRGDALCADVEFNADCILSKRMHFEISASDLRDIAASYRRGDAGSFVFRFKDAIGQHHTNRLVPAEVAGLMQAVATYTATAGIRTATNVASADPS